MIEALKARLNYLKRETHALALAQLDPRTPWYARVWVGVVLAYFFSPIDLIPDFIPVLGVLDDLIIVPAGVVIALKLIPHEVMADARARAHQQSSSGRSNIAAAAVVILIWVGLAALMLSAIF